VGGINQIATSKLRKRQDTMTAVMVCHHHIHRQIRPLSPSHSLSFSIPLSLFSNSPPPSPYPAPPHPILILYFSPPLY
jgi:hypothetical protein